MRAEQIRPGNPNKLIKDQHVLPRKSIARFADADGLVAVRIHGKPGERRLQPKNPIFCARRGWDNPSERSHTRLENKFQVVAEAVLAGKTEFSQEERHTITRFYRLCELRFETKHNPAEDRVANGAIPSGPPLTQEQQENLESNGYGFMVGNALPAQQFAGMRISMGLLALTRDGTLEKTTWAVVTSKTVEFVVPDFFRACVIVPLSPNCCLIANRRSSGAISAETVMALNRVAAQQSEQYYFARDFSKCGI